MGLVLSSSHCFRYGSGAWVFVLSTFGWLLGYLIEGPNFSLPQSPLLWIYVIPPLIVSILTVLSYPTSITQLYVSTLLGYSLATNYQQGLMAVARIALSWVLSFVAGLILSMLIHRSLRGIARFTRITLALVVLRVLSLAHVFLLSYVLGGNLLGAMTSLLGVDNSFKTRLLLSTAIAASVYTSFKSKISLGLVKILFPTKYLTSLIPYSVSIILTQVANRLGLPVVISLVMFSSTLGVGLASEHKLLRRRRVLVYLTASYMGPFALSSLLSYAFTSVFVIGSPPS